MAKVTVIAEAGINHNGNIQAAMAMADVAKGAGADIVKYQTFWGLPDLPNLPAETSRQLELTKPQWQHLKLHCDRIGIEFMSTPDTIEAVNFLRSIGMTNCKISHRPVFPEILQAIGAQFSTLYVSYELTEYKPVGNFCKYLLCVGKYPAECSDYDLRQLNPIDGWTPWSDGISDHTPGIHLPIAAVGAGATVIEKHFTLDQSQRGPDHSWSLNPRQLSEMISAIRKVEQAL